MKENRIEMDKISIVIPVYNAEKYLEKCINSIISQTYKNLEIIIVDDGSLDKSGEIADEFQIKDKRIKVIHKKNEGVSTARNVGIDACTGKYICFADADDYLMNDYVEYLYDLISNNDADISLTTEMFTTFRKEQSNDKSVTIYSGEDATYAILCYNLPIGVYCKMFRREFLGDKIRFLPNIFIGEGFNFNTSAFQRARKVVVGHKKIYFYRRDNPTSATTKFSINKWENAIFAIDNIRKNLIINTPKLEKGLEYAYWHTNCDAYNFMVIAGEQYRYPKEYKRYLSIVRKQAKTAFSVNIKPREKLRAIISVICPKIIPILMKFRYKHYNVQ